MKIIAHRGNKRYTPENTLAAFSSALTYPVDGIEFDVQVTKDGIPVVIHDEKIDRTTNGRGFVSSLTYNELIQFDAGGWFHDSFRGEKIPSLAQVLEWGKNRNITLHVELKPQKMVFHDYLERCLQLIEEFNMVETVVISSFQHAYLAYLKSKNPLIKTALLTKNPIFRGEVYARKMKADAIHIRHSYQAARFYKKWTENGLIVRAYNVHHLKDVMKCHRLNIDSVITNDPKLLTEVIRKQR